MAVNTSHSSFDRFEPRKIAFSGNLVNACDFNRVILEEMTVELIESPFGVRMNCERPIIDVGEFWMGPEICVEVWYQNHTSEDQWLRTIPASSCTGCNELIYLPPHGEYRSQFWLRSIRVGGRFEKSLRVRLLLGEEPNQLCTHCRSKFDSPHHNSACGPLCRPSDEEFCQACFGK